MPKVSFEKPNSFIRIYNIKHQNYHKTNAEKLHIKKTKAKHNLKQQYRSNRKSFKE